MPDGPSTTPTRDDADTAIERRLIHVVLAIALASSFALKLVNLGHAALRGLDESFHAVVAANLLKHPFTPTFIDRPYLPADYEAWRDEPPWLHAHVWLHKPILPLWQIAVSFAILGTGTFALRLPSALLSTAAVWLTYAIGKELIDRRAGVVAAILQAFNPAILMLVHGYVFSDHVDVSLLFWTELSIWLLVKAAVANRSKVATRWIALAGLAQGLGYLSKTYPALIVTGIAFVTWLLSRGARDRDLRLRLTGHQLLLLIATTFATIVPWTIHAAIRWPREFVAENLRILSHLNTNVESWAGPWDRVIFAYLLNAQYLFYTTALAAAVVLVVPAWRGRDCDRRIWLNYAWMLGVLVPFTLARSKTPSATLLAWPAMFLMVGALVSRATRGDLSAAATWAVATVLAIALRGDIPQKSFGADSPVLTSLGEAPWVLWHVIAACGIGLLALSVVRRDRVPRRAVTTVALVASLASLWLLALTMGKVWAVTQINARHPGYVSLGRFVRDRLPDNAVMLCDEKVKLERNTLMFRADRTCYPLDPQDPSQWERIARDVVAAGGRPYIVSHRDLPLRRLSSDADDGRAIYDWDR